MSSIAIVAMDCIFPGAGDLETYWNNLVSGRDCISDVPAARWDKVFYDPSSKSPDRFYCKRGGFVDEFAVFDPIEFGIMPLAAQGAEPEQLLTLKVASRALATVKLPARDKCGVILGRGNYIGAGMTRLEQHVRTAEQLAVALRDLVPDLSDAQIEKAKSEFRSKLGRYGADTAIGLVPNLTSSRIANRLDFRGPVYTLDAACASSLIAIERACAELESGNCDLMVAGGVHLSHDVAFWSVFSQMGALSRGQQIRPFDKKADGLLIGEGVGVVVLKRLEQALQDGDTIYAVIKGCGVASDGRAATLMDPSSEGQTLAIERAWKSSGLDTSQLGQLEAHGTGTAVGDQVELKSIHQALGSGSNEAVLGSVKSMIGHTMPAAGVAGIIKMALGLYHRKQLPSLHCEEPRTELSGSRFKLISKARDWEGTDASRVAAVNAFGFGGINAHIVMTEAPASTKPKATRSGPAETALILSARSKEELLQKLEAKVSHLDPEGAFRLGILNPTPEKLAKAREIILKGHPCRGIQGIWYVSSGLLKDGGKIAFMFPGIDSVVRPDLTEVADRFSATFGSPSLGAASLKSGEDIEGRGLEVFTTSELYKQVFSRLKIIPQAVFGHSLGEWSAMVASGLTFEQTVNDVVSRLQPGIIPIPGVVFAALGCGVEQAREAIQGLNDVEVSHDNCPHQSIICGDEKSVEQALDILRDRNVICQKLDFRSGFHTRLFKPFVGPFEKGIQEMRFSTAKFPLWSATTCEPYPQDEAGIRALCVAHLLEPVRFRELTQKLYDQGFRVFIQVGTGSLSGFIDDTLRDRPHQALSPVVASRGAMEQLQRFCLALFAEGADFDMEFLFGATLPKKAAPMQLQLGIPLVRMDHRLDLGRVGPALKSPSNSPLMADLQASFDEMQKAATEITAALAPPKGFTKKVRLELTVQNRPELMDHSFFKQKKGWTNLSDLFPVVPMTGSIDLVLKLAAEHFSDQKVVAIEQISATKWLAVEVPKVLDIEMEFDGKSRVRFNFVGHFSATAILQAAYPAAPAPKNEPLLESRTSDVNAEELYRDGWMFHGPAFQCVSQISKLGTNGITGKIKATSVPGALLDNAGQLFGFWIMQYTTENRYAMPVRIKRIEFFGAQPDSGEVDCEVRIQKLGLRDVSAHLEIQAGGRVWARIENWEDWRFESDDKLWEFLMSPGQKMLSDVREVSPDHPSYAWFEREELSSPTCEDLSHRYLRETERKFFGQLKGKRDSWIAGRIAAKDAIRQFLWSRGFSGPIFPAEIEITNDSNGRPLISELPEGSPFERLYLSISHKGSLGVATVSESPEVGIDVEGLEARSDQFAQNFLTAEELALLPSSQNPELRAEWITRFWAAKEAFAKSTGRGLAGNPKAIQIGRVEQDRIRVEGKWISTKILGKRVLGLTLKENYESK